MSPASRQIRLILFETKIYTDIWSKIFLRETEAGIFLLIFFIFIVHVCLAFPKPLSEKSSLQK